MESIPLIEMALRIGAAVGLGALVGLERERKRRPVGFRTMILVSVGCAGFMLAGHELAVEAEVALSRSGYPVDPISRVLQGLLGGVGFLGAGSVIHSKGSVRGMTTAAATWVVAAIGASCGLGFFKLASMLSIAALFTLIVLELVEHKYFPDEHDGEAPPTVVRIDAANWNSEQKTPAVAVGQPPADSEPPPALPIPTPTKVP